MDNINNLIKNIKKEYPMVKVSYKKLNDNKYDIYYDRIIDIDNFISYINNISILYNININEYKQMSIIK